MLRSFYLFTRFSFLPIRKQSSVIKKIGWYKCVCHYYFAVRHTIPIRREYRSNSDFIPQIIWKVICIWNYSVCDQTDEINNNNNNNIITSFTFTQLILMQINAEMGRSCAEIDTNQHTLLKHGNHWVHITALCRSAFKPIGHWQKRTTRI